MEQATCRINYCVRPIQNMLARIAQLEHALREVMPNHPALGAA